jgi:raffinose/stachyose/melibiose transport system permease protein
MTRKRQHIEFFLFLAPALIGYSLFFIFPFLRGVFYSLHKWNGYSPNMTFVGFDNYIKAFSNRGFVQSFKFTFSYALGWIVVGNCLAFSLALFLNRRFVGRNFLRTLCFAPSVINVVIIGFVWRFLLTRFKMGLYETTTWKIFGITYLLNDKLVLYMSLMVKAWSSAGWFMIIYLAALQSIPKETVEAAIIDGAGGFSRFRFITLPFMYSTIGITMFITIIGGLREFALLWILTQGGPGQVSTTIAMVVYRDGFQVFRFGFASAEAVLFALTLFVITSFQRYLFKKREIVL